MSGTDPSERGLLPYPVIAAAVKSDPNAMRLVVQHYDSYISSLSMRRVHDRHGNSYYGADEDMRDRLRSKLMQSVLKFKI